MTLCQEWGTRVVAGAVVLAVTPRWTAAMRGRRRRRGKRDRLDAAAVAQVVRQEAALLPVVVREDETTVLGVLVSEREEALAEATRLRTQSHPTLAQRDPCYAQWVGDLTEPEAATVARLTVYVAPSAAALEQAEARKRESEREAKRAQTLHRAGGVAAVAGGAGARRSRHPDPRRLTPCHTRVRISVARWSG